MSASALAPAGQVDVDLPGELWVQIFAWFGDDDLAAARAAATCRAWRRCVHGAYGARFAVAVRAARSWLGRLPRYHAHRGAMLRGRTSVELATAEDALRQAVPRVALCNGRLPTFLRAVYAVTGGQEADGEEYCEQALFASHGILCPLPSAADFVYGGYFCYLSVSLSAWLGDDVGPGLLGGMDDAPELHHIYLDGLVFAAACMEEHSWALYWKGGRVFRLDHQGDVVCHGAPSAWLESVLQSAAVDGV